MAKRKRGIFTPEFKAKVVFEALRGETFQTKVCRRHNLSEEQLSTWKRQLFETLHLSLSRGIRHPRRQRSESLNWSNSLGS